MLFSKLKYYLFFLTWNVVKVYFLTFDPPPKKNRCSTIYSMSFDHSSEMSLLLWFKFPVRKLISRALHCFVGIFDLPFSIFEPHTSYFPAFPEWSYWNMRHIMSCLCWKYSMAPSYIQCISQIFILGPSNL